MTQHERDDIQAWALLRSGEAFLVEPVARAESPIPFWIISAMWAAFGVWIVAADLRGPPW